MGRIVSPRGELTSTFSEVVGYKSGLALNQEQLASHLDPHYTDLMVGNVDELVTVRSEEAEEIVSNLLYAVGSTPVPHRVMVLPDLIARFRNDARGRRVVRGFTKILLAEFQKQEKSETPFDFTPVLLQMLEEFGSKGSEVAMTFLELSEISNQQTPWSRIRRIEWKDIAELEELFRSESLETSYGSYIDQRFIDYLARNPESIDTMNWRKFEGLTCEYFEKAGFYVQISEGRNDGGIDARVWPNEEQAGNPPTMLIQCKRQKAKIEKVVVKALWSDVVDENAKSGLIVTTSELSPGAAQVCKARSYAIGEANRETVQSWLKALRTPDTGVFLGL